MDEKTKELLINLSDKYEKREFIEKDPSRFMHDYKENRDKEVAAFIASALSFGRREQILSHVKKILDECGSSPADWLLSGKHNEFFDEGEKSFYRYFSHNDLKIYCENLSSFLKNSPDGTLGSYFRSLYEEERGKEDGRKYLHQIVCSAFSADCALVPRTKTSAAKKVNMMLRWLVRKDSPVDLGIWTWFSQENLLMPLDTHVMSESYKLNLLLKTPSGKEKSASLKTAIILTEVMKEVFPLDPVRADFALFGLGVDENGI